MKKSERLAVKSTLYSHKTLWCSESIEELTYLESIDGSVELPGKMTHDAAKFLGKITESSVCNPFLSIKSGIKLIEFK